MFLPKYSLIESNYVIKTPWLTDPILTLANREIFSSLVKSINMSMDLTDQDELQASSSETVASKWVHFAHFPTLEWFASKTDSLL